MPKKRSGSALLPKLSCLIVAFSHSYQNKGKHNIPTNYLNVFQDSKTPQWIYFMECKNANQLFFVRKQYRKMLGGKLFTRPALSQFYSLNNRRPTNFVYFRNVVQGILNHQNCKKVGRDARSGTPTENAL